jgi:hypothetical protein
MDAEFARKYLDGEVTIEDAPQPASTETNTNPSDAGTPPAKDDKPEDQQPDQGGSGASSETPAETKPSEDGGIATQQTEEGKDSKGKPGFLEGKKDNRLPYPHAKDTDLEKMKANQAFIRQKDKYKKKVAQLEEQNAKLKEQLLKFSAVNVESLKNDPEKLMDLKLAKNNIQTQMRNIEAQRKAAQEEQDAIEAENANRVYQERVEACFTDEAEKNHYNTLMNNGRDKFVAFLQQYDPENAVLQYLDDCDISPLMVRTLMTNPKALRAVIEKRNPVSKAMELKMLENRIMLERRLKQTSGSPKKASTPPTNKLPSTGSQTNPGGGSTQDPVRDTNYWKNYLETHS